MAYTAPTTVSAGDAVTATAQNILVNNDIALREASTYIGTQTRATDYNITATTVASAADVFASDITFTAISGKLYKFEAYASNMFAGSASNNYDIHLVNGAGTSLGVMAFLRSAGGSTWVPFGPQFLYAAGSGSVSFNLRGVKDGGSDGALSAGLNVLPIRFTIYGPID